MNSPMLKKSAITLIFLVVNCSNCLGSQPGGNLGFWVIGASWDLVVVSLNFSLHFVQVFHVCLIGPNRNLLFCKSSLLRDQRHAGREGVPAYCISMSSQQYCPGSAFHTTTCLSWVA
ncbi:hypothetical protein FKM82_026259 [Ascaphus truei]